MNNIPVIFLDRDGTINEEVNYLHKPEDLHILPGVPEAIRRFRQVGYRIAVITNQAGVARGYYTEPDVERLHQYLNEELKKQDAWIDAFYYCPHHPQHGIGKYRTECECRKPGIGMFQQAEHRFTIDREVSWMIGDKLIDTEAGRRFGLHTALVGTGYGSRLHNQICDAIKAGSSDKEVPYELFAETLMDAARAITGSD